MTQRNHTVVNQSNTNDISHTEVAISEFAREDSKIDKLILSIPRLAIIRGATPTLLHHYLLDIISTEDAVGDRPFRSNLTRGRLNNTQYKVDFISGVKHINGYLLFTPDHTGQIITISAKLTLNPTRYLAHISKRRDITDESSVAEKLKIISAIKAEIASTTYTGTDNFIGDMEPDTFREGFNQYVQEAISYPVVICTQTLGVSLHQTHSQTLPHQNNWVAVH